MPTSVSSTFTQDQAGHAEFQETPVHHERRRPAFCRLAGADEAVRFISLRGGNEQNAVHDVVCVAGAGTDLEPELTQPPHDICGAGHQIGVARRHLEVHRHEDLVHRVNVGLSRRVAMCRFPGNSNPRQRQQRCDVRALGHDHRLARLVHREVDAEARKSFDERSHRREGAMVDHRSGPVGLQLPRLDVPSASGHAEQLGDGLLGDGKSRACTRATCDDDNADAIVCADRPA
jgi:hypothetical protein